MILMLPGITEAVIGLEWGTAVPSEWKAIQKERKAQGKLAVAFQVTDKETKETVINYGLIDKDAPELEGNSKKVSLAGLVAASYPDGLVMAIERVPNIEDEAEDIFWFCVVNDGQVLAGTDITGSASKIEAAIQDVDLVLETSEATVIGSGAHIRSIEADGESVTDLLDLTKVGQAQVQKGSNGGVLKLVLASVLSITAVVAAATFFLLGDSKPKQQQLTAEQLLQMQQQQARIDLQAKEAEVMSSAAFVPTMSGATALTGRLPAKAGGWELTETTCDVKTCISQYINKDMTLPGVLEVAAAEVCEGVVFDSRAESATCVSASGGMTIEAVKTDWKLSEADRRTLLNTLMVFAKSLPGDAGYSITEAEPISFPGREALPAAEVFRVGQWGIQMRSDWTDAALHMLYTNKALAVDQITFNWGEDKAEVSGRYMMTGEAQ